MIELLIYAMLNYFSFDFLPQSLEPSEIDFLSSFVPAAVPLQYSGAIAPVFTNIQDRAIFARDLNSGKTLFARNIDTALPVASLTKLMTAHLILREHDLDELVMVSPLATRVAGARIGLYGYEKLRVRDLLSATLIASANDAALALAIFNAGSEQEFAKKMNDESRKLGFNGSKFNPENSAKFFNATGLDMIDSDGNLYGNRMSIRDLEILVKNLLKNDFFRETVSKEVVSISSVNEKFTHSKKSTNKLLGTFLNLKGIKTGFTPFAKECFVSLGERGEAEILTIVLGSDSRFVQTKILLSWIYDSFLWR